jgi:hypothetical protein
MVSEGLKAVLTGGTREEKAALAFEFLSLLLGDDPPPEVTILRPNGDVFGTFVSPQLRRRLLTIDQLETLDRRSEATAVSRPFKSLETLSVPEND